MSLLVVDASVAIKWFLPEIHAVMVTADEKLYNALRSGSLASSLCWVGDVYMIQDFRLDHRLCRGESPPRVRGDRGDQVAQTGYFHRTLQGGVRQPSPP